MKSKRICVIGLGYIGLPLAVFLAESGYEVLGVDIDTNKIVSLQNQEPIIKEKHFSEHFYRAIDSGNISFSTKPVRNDIFIIAVPTPLDKKTNSADLSYVLNALDSILPVLSKGNLIILESTVPPRTCRDVIKKIIEEKTPYLVSKDIFIAHCPERAYPGNLVYEFINNDRIIGGMSLKATDEASEVYRSFVKGNILLTDDVTAEFVKLAENTYRDINIAYANELRLLCDASGIDYKQVTKFANCHPRVNILESGIGVGGHCIPIDPWFLWQNYPDISKLIPTARQINDQMPEYIVNKIINKIPKGIKKPKILLVGKTYKPNITDTRESPALEIAKIFESQNEQFEIKVVDPLIDDISVNEITNLAMGTDLLVVLVPHDIVTKFIKENKEMILKTMRTPVIVFANEI